MSGKTKQRGYYYLKPAKKWLHFSMNCWINLKEDTGKTIMEIGNELDGKEPLDQFKAYCDVAYAAMKANDQEEGNEIDYNIYNVRQWMESVSNNEKAGSEFYEAMTHSLTNPAAEGKKTAKK